MKVLKKNNSVEDFNIEKVMASVSYAYRAAEQVMPISLDKLLRHMYRSKYKATISTGEISKDITNILMRFDPKVAFKYIAYNENKKSKSLDKWFKVDEKTLRQILSESVLFRAIGKTQAEVMSDLSWDEDTLKLEIDILLSKFIIE